MLSLYVRRASARTSFSAFSHGVGAPARPPPERHGPSPLPPDLPSLLPEISPKLQLDPPRSGLPLLYHGVGTPSAPPSMERHGSSTLPPDLPMSMSEMTHKLRLPRDRQITTQQVFSLSGSAQRRYVSSSHGVSSGPWQYKPKKNTVHALPTMDLPTFLQCHPAIVQVTLPGDSTETAMVSDIVARAFSSAGVLLERNDRAGISFAYPIDPSMLRVDMHGTVQIAPGTWIKHATRASAYLDKYYLGKLFDYCLSEAYGGPSIPADWRHLLDRMQNMGGCQGYRFLVDPAFLNSSVWPYSYMDMFQYLEELELRDRTKHTAVVGQIPMPAGGWDADIKQSALPTLFYNNRGIDKKGALIPTNRNAYSEKQRGKYYRNGISHANDYTQVLPHSTQELYQSLRAKGGGQHLAEMVEAVHKHEQAQRPADWKPMLAALGTERHLCHDFSPCCPGPKGCLRKILSLTRDPDPEAPAASSANSDVSLVCADLAALGVNYSIDQWKQFCSKTTDKDDLSEGFWRLFNAKETSIWLSDCCGGEVFKEERNKVVGLTYQLGLLGKDYTYGKAVIVGPRPFNIRGVWMFKGLRIPDFVQNGPYISQFQWRPVNLADSSDKQIVDSIIAERGSFGSSIVFRKVVS